MSFEFENSKDKNHILNSLIQELRKNSCVEQGIPFRTTILETFRTTGLILNFDLDTQLKLSILMDEIKEFDNRKGLQTTMDALMKQQIANHIEDVVIILQDIITADIKTYIS